MLRLNLLFPSLQWSHSFYLFIFLCDFSGEAGQTLSPDFLASVAVGTLRNASKQGTVSLLLYNLAWYFATTEMPVGRMIPGTQS